MDISIILYIGTFASGFILDKYLPEKNKLIKHLFVLWLFIFFCFGYMTGSDWRSYELFYANSSSKLNFATTEKGFYLLFDLLHHFIDDFFITLGLLKCFYLASLIFLLRKVTKFWLSAISILMPLCLDFMLIDNPLRFMVALIFINIGLSFLLKGDLWKFIIISIIASFFHITSLVITPLLFVAIYYNKITYGLKRRYLILLYLVCLVVFSSPAPFQLLINLIVPLLHSFGSKSYSSYTESVDMNPFFTLGSFFNVFFFFLLIKFKDIFLKYKYGKEIFSASIFCLILFRITLVIPTGFRLIIPLQSFVGVSFICIIKSSRLYKWLLITFFFLSLSKSLIQAYVYLPYSNSIPYIMTRHKKYWDRRQYNILEYYKRTGKRHDS